MTEPTNDDSAHYREIENLWIPVGSGIRLAARAWLPERPCTEPVPALLEYLPYRKRDRTRERDEAMHRDFARHGYAVLRVDVRGSGDSDGILADEYSEEELADGAAVIAWIAAQPWCNGRVGMLGKSWGGFNALQIAARAPPALRAVISVCASDDRYGDDAHFMGGCLLNENQIWGALLFTLNALPPDPAIVGERWRAQWQERLEHSRPFPALWLRHPLRDEYWQHGSVCENYARILAPVYAIGGWLDPYHNAVPRLLANVHSPCKGLIGPWAHQYPHQGTPGPAIDFLHEARRWFDTWLRDRNTGILEEPRYRAWMHNRPGDEARDAPAGGWIAEDHWPSRDATPQAELRYGLTAAGLTVAANGSGVFSCSSPQTTGSAAGQWCASGFAGDLPGDQRCDDARSLCFDSAVLQQDMEIFGAPLLEVDVESDQTVAFLVARLNEIEPDGRSTRITFGCLNLTHRRGHDRVLPMPRSGGERIRLPLSDIAWRVRAGHRLRLALSTCYWPMLWPPPCPVRLRIAGDRSALTLPLRTPRDTDRTLREFGAARTAAATPKENRRMDRCARSTSIDPATGRTVLLARTDFAASGGVALEHIASIDLTMGHSMLERFEIDDQDPLSARVLIEHDAVLERGAWQVRIATQITLESDAEHFRLGAALRACEKGARPLVERHWSEQIPRRGL